MPLTPSIGLAFIIHVTVIIIYHLLRQPALAIEHDKGFNAAASKFFGLIIVFAVSFVSFTAAVGILTVCLTDEHSSINVAKVFASKFLDITPVQAPTFAVVPDSVNDEVKKNTAQSQLMTNSVVVKNDSSDLEQQPLVSIKKEDASIDCQKIFNEAAANYRWSIVNYLRAHNLDHGMQQRMELAAELGMEQYDATSDDNLKLLMKLLVKNNELPTEALIQCQVRQQ